MKTEKLRFNRYYLIYILTQISVNVTIILMKNLIINIKQ